MAIGIVNDTEFDSESSKLDSVINERSSSREGSNIPIVNNGVVIDVNRGRGENNVAVPDALQKIIGETSNIEGRQAALDFAAQFGIKPSSVSAYAAGSASTATYNEPKEELINHNNDAKLRVAKKARGRLMSALRALTPEKIGEAKPREIAGIAKDMSVVIKNMEPDAPPPNQGENRPQFVFYAPQFHKEEHFETIYAKD